MASLVTDRSRSRSSRLAEPLGLAGLALAGAVALQLRDPHTQGSWGFCPFLVLTGQHCPACGSLRAVNDLGRGDVLGAVSSNLLLFLGGVVFAVFWIGWVRSAWTGRPRRPLPWSRGMTVVAVVVTVAFTVLRNLPVGAWLAP